MNGSSKMLNIKVHGDNSSTPESCPLSPASTVDTTSTTTTDKLTESHGGRPRKLSGKRLMHTYHICCICTKTKPKGRKLES